ncbi:MAG: sulfatase-like hydrolase/transferase, partial [Rubripirellula sp.]
MFRLSLLSLSCVCCLFWGRYVDSAEIQHPNVLFVLVDDLGYMDIAANNPGTFYETPNIDRLANSGTRFSNGYAANPVCS